MVMEPKKDLDEATKLKAEFRAGVHSLQQENIEVYQLIESLRKKKDEANVKIVQ